MTSNASGIDHTLRPILIPVTLITRNPKTTD